MIGTKMAVWALALGGAGVLGAGALGARALAFGGHHDHAMRRKFIDFMVNEKLDAIGATDAQKQKVVEIKDRLLQEAQALHPDHTLFRREILGLLEQDNPDPARLRALVHERTLALTRFADQAVDAALELHDVLTPEQRQKIRADIEAHMEARHRF